MSLEDDYSGIFTISFEVLLRKVRQLPRDVF